MPHGAPSQVTQDELRAALTTGASQRSPAWNWNAELADPERTELDALRRHVADLQAQVAQLREHADAATKTAQDLRAALTRLASATARQRRRVIADLRAGGLLANRPPPARAGLRDLAVRWQLRFGSAPDARGRARRRGWRRGMAGRSAGSPRGVPIRA
jgi:hypothetical protein